MCGCENNGWRGQSLVHKNHNPTTIPSLSAIGVSNATGKIGRHCSNEICPVAGQKALEYWDKTHKILKPTSKKIVKKDLSWSPSLYNVCPFLILSAPFAPALYILCHQRDRRQNSAWRCDWLWWPERLFLLLLCTQKEIAGWFKWCGTDFRRLQQV